MMHKTLVPSVTPIQTAVSDFRQNAGKFVQICNDGFVRLADANSVGVCATLCLGNAPGSGQACELIGAPNVQPMVVASITQAGQAVTCHLATGLATVTSFGNTNALGYAMEPANTGSGEIIGIKLFRA